MQNVITKSVRARGLSLIAGLSLLGRVATASGAVVDVHIVDYAFDPETANIQAGDTINWIWDGFYHSTTSTENLWDSYLYDPPYSFQYTFNNSGSYPYLCTAHFFYGTINVAAATLPPTVTITSPADGTVFSAPANVTLEAYATGNSGTLTNVAFYQGNTLLGNDTASPYSQSANGLAAGNYTFSAVGKDDLGLSTTNSIGIQVVTAGTITLNSPLKISTSSFRFSYPATTGLTYVVQRAISNPTNWASISTNVAASNPVVYVDIHATSNPAFYRVVRVPNP